MVEKISEETQRAIEDFQNYQQQLQNLLIQKETLKLKNIEIEKALEEINNTNQKIAYKITGSIMVEKPIEEIKKELSEEKEALEIKIKSLEKTEERIAGKLKELQSKLESVLK